MIKAVFILHQKIGNSVSILTIGVIFSLFLLVVSVPVQAGEVTQTSITINWTSPGDNGTSGTAALYDIRYSTSMVNSGSWTNCSQADNEPIPQLGGNPESFTIDDLAPNTWYYIAIMSSDEVSNWSALSNVIAVKTLSLSLDVDEDGYNLPDDFHLAQNFPNPFNPSTRIQFSIPVTAHVTISIFNMLGQETATIIDEIKPAGNYSVVWDGVDTFGRKVSSGIYLYRIQADNFTESKKMALVQ